MSDLIFFERYQRQISLPQISFMGQKRIAQAKVLCVGAGGLGSPLCFYLVSCGLGHLGIIDADIVDRSNLHRQILFEENDCGVIKAECAKQKLKKLNSHCQITSYNEFLSEQNALDIIQHYDIIADCSDNFATRYLINDACVTLNKTYVMASVQGFSGQLAIFPGQKGPCYRCLFESINPNAIPNCNDAGILGTTTGVFGSLQASEILKLITNIDAPIIGKVALINLLNLSIKILSLTQNKSCPSCAKRLNFSDLSRPVFSCTPPVKSAALNMEAFKQLQQSANNLVIIDVRQPQEYYREHLPNAINIPLQKLEHSITSLDKKSIIILYCETSVRSIKAYQELIQRDFEKVYYLEYGYSQAKFCNNSSHLL